MIQIQFDPNKKKASIKVELKGESSPIQIDVDSYTVNSEGSKPVFKLIKANCSRPWLDALVKNFVTGKEFQLPSQAGDYIKLADDVLK